MRARDIKRITWAEVFAKHQSSPFVGFRHITHIGSLRIGPIIALYPARGSIIILPLWTACRDVNPYDTFDQILSPPLKIKARNVTPSIEFGMVSFNVPGDGKIDLISDTKEFPGIHEIRGLSKTDKARTRAWQESTREKRSSAFPRADILLAFV